MRIPATAPLFAWTHLDDEHDLKTLKQILDQVDDQGLLAALRQPRQGAVAPAAGPRRACAVRPPDCRRGAWPAAFRPRFHPAGLPSALRPEDAAQLAGMTRMTWRVSHSVAQTPTRPGQGDAVGGRHRMRAQAPREPGAGPRPTHLHVDAGRGQVAGLGAGSFSLDSRHGPAPAVAMRTMRSHHLPLFLALLSATIAVASAGSQCTSRWLPGTSRGGPHGPYFATEHWDPDGPGALPPVVVVGGYSGARVWQCNLATGAWSALGLGTDGDVLALAVGNGELFAGGLFTTAGGLGANRVARWNGSAWSPLGAGMNGPVHALKLLANGDLIAAGDFTTAGGVNAGRIARWDGTRWWPVGPGMNGVVHALTALANGDLVAGGQFYQVGTASIERVARWNGTTWSALATPGPDHHVLALTTMANGDLVVGGKFANFAGAPMNYVARWNGSTWSAMGPGLNGWVHSLVTLPNGHVVAGGRFSGYVMEWNGTQWSPLGNGLNKVALSCAALPNGDLVASGVGLARWDGASWTGFDSQSFTDHWIHVLKTMPNGDLIAGGDFEAVPGQAANRIARWDGTRWSALGTGLGGTPLALATLRNGDLIAGGLLSGGTGTHPQDAVWRWDGTSWWPIGAFLDNHVQTLLVLTNGHLIVGGNFSRVAGGQPANRVARWDGTTWSALGNGLAYDVSALAQLPNGDIVAGGAGYQISRWNGSTWSSMGAVDVWVNTFLVLPNGDLIAGGIFTTVGGVPANRIARWNGSTWSPLGSGLNAQVLSLARLPNGDIVAAGDFTMAGGSNANRIARWNGSMWSALQGGTDDRVFAVAVGGEQLFAGGKFTQADGRDSHALARYATPCPAVVAPHGAGCVSSGGACTYAALTQPWVGTTFQGRGYNLPALALVAVVTGFSTVQLPLGALLPPSPEPCQLLVTPEHAAILVANGGGITTQLPIPNQVSLAGLTVHQQLVVLELNGQLQLIQNTSSNALSLQVGNL